MKKSATQVIDRVDVRYSKLTVLNTLADEEVSAFDVLDAFMMFRIVGEIDGGLVVAAKLDGVIYWLLPGRAEALQQTRYQLVCWSVMGQCAARRRRS